MHEHGGFSFECGGHACHIQVSAECKHISLSAATKGPRSPHLFVSRTHGESCLESSRSPEANLPRYGMADRFSIPETAPGESMMTGAVIVAVAVAVVGVLRVVVGRIVVAHRGHAIVVVLIVVCRVILALATLIIHVVVCAVILGPTALIIHVVVCAVVFPVSTMPQH